MMAIVQRWKILQQKSFRSIFKKDHYFKLITNIEHKKVSAAIQSPRLLYGLISYREDMVKYN